MSDAPTPGPDRVDPVLARRAQIGRLTDAGQRIGYALFVVAVVAFVAGAVGGFTPAVTLTVTIALLAGSVVLAPAIVFGYAVRAAERDDRQQGRPSGAPSGDRRPER